MMSAKLNMTVAAAIAAAIALSAKAEGQHSESKQQKTETAQKQQTKRDRKEKAADATGPALTKWDYGDLYRDGWTADALMDAEVFGPNGKEIGSVENLLINQDGEIVAVVAQVGGFWDIGDTHVAVPWNRVKIGEDWHVTIPITEETAENYSIFKDEYYTKIDTGVTQEVSDTLDTGPHIWKATDLLNDYALLEDGATYGFVTDLVFDKGGDLKSVVVLPSAGYGGAYGYYAYPWQGAGWSPTYGYYELPYSASEVDGITVFNYDYVNDIW